MKLILLIVYGFIMILIIEIATILLHTTGLEKPVARFQAISLLTGTGYTTSESELVIRHPVRRKVAGFLIIFGIFSFAVMISLMVSILLERAYSPAELAVVIAMLFGFYFLLRNKAFQNFLSQSVEKQYNKYDHREQMLKEAISLIDEDFVLHEVLLTEEHPHLIDKPLKELALAEQDVKVLYIQRGEALLKNPTGSTKLFPGDRVLIYGREPRFGEIFRPR